MNNKFATEDNFKILDQIPNNSFERSFDNLPHFENDIKDNQGPLIECAVDDIRISKSQRQSMVETADMIK